jgi:hypothetical protein
LAATRVAGDFEEPDGGKNTITALEVAIPLLAVARCPATHGHLAVVITPTKTL